MEHKPENSYRCEEHPDAATQLVIRARDAKRVWGATQVVECQRCGAAWSV